MPSTDDNGPSDDNVAHIGVRSDDPLHAHALNAHAARLAELEFIVSYNRLAAQVNETAVEKGWWDNERNDAEMICLMHSELSEALEGLRDGNPPDDKLPEFSSVAAEMADVIIRIMDFGHARGHCIAEAIIAKMAFNTSREHKHGGKKF